MDLLALGLTETHPSTTASPSDNDEVYSNTGLGIV